MKKLLSFIIAAAMLATMFSGCGNAPAETAAAPETTASETTASFSEAAETTASATNTTSEAAANTEKTETAPAAETTTETTEPTTAEQAKAETPTECNLVFSAESGIYPSEFELSIDGGDIIYTTDGSDPTRSTTAKPYTAPIKITDRKSDKNYVSAVPTSVYDSKNVERTREGFKTVSENPTDEAVDKCTVIRAAEKNSDGSYSAIKTATYFIGTAEEHIEGLRESCEAAGERLAVISLTVDYEDLFNYETGIYTKGKLYDDAIAELLEAKERIDAETSRRVPANYNQRGREWERAAHVSLFEFEADGAELALEQNCGVRIQGNYSRSDLIKGFRIFARSDYGEKNFKYDVFGEDLKNDSGETMDKFKTLTLRAGGNYAFGMKFNDAYWQELVKNLDCETMENRPCVVYLDGEYWGLYVLQEDYSDDYFEETHGVNKDDVVLYKGDAETYEELGYKLDIGDLPEGETYEGYYFKSLTDFYKSHKNLVSDADYEEFQKIVDVESALDYFAAEIWINNKWDWPGKNWSMWRTINVDPANEYADGRWRFCFYDMEFGGCGGEGEIRTNTVKEDNYEEYGLLDTATKNVAVLCYAYLMTNDKARALFAEKLLGLENGAFEKTNALKVLNTYADTYAPLYEQFFNRYPGTGDAEMVLVDYAGRDSIAAFVEGRAGYMQKIVDHIDKTIKKLVE